MAIKFIFKKRPLPGDDAANRQALERPYYYPATNYGGTGEVPVRVWEVRKPAQLIYGGGTAINDVNWGGNPFFELASTSLAEQGPQPHVGPPPRDIQSPLTFGNTSAF